MLSLSRLSVNQLRSYGKNVTPKEKGYYLVVVSGGELLRGGLSIASKFVEVLSILDKGKVAVIEPNDTHYYQSMWARVGAGIKNLSDSSSPMSYFMPKKVHWIKDKCMAIEPDKNQVRVSGANGIIKYEYLLVAVGMNIDWYKIKGLPDAFETPGVCSNFSINTVTKTFPAIQSIKEGNAIFTFPSGPIKCSEAPQKIMFLADKYWRQHGIRDKINIIYNTAEKAHIFPNYAKDLTKIMKDRNISVNFGNYLLEVIADKKEAVFEDLKTNEMKRLSYNLLHISPPMSAPPLIQPIADPKTGFVAVNKKTLQHLKYPNIFAIGDCASDTTFKSAAEVAAQNTVVAGNLLAQMRAGTVSHHLGQEFKKYIPSTQLPQPTLLDVITSDPNYIKSVELAFKLGYTKSQIQTALMKLGLTAGHYKLMAELIKLGAGAGNNTIPVFSGLGKTLSEDILYGEHCNNLKLRPIVIDGSNVALSHGNKQCFSCMGIKICVEWFQARGHREVTVFVPLWRKGKARPDSPIKDQEILSQLESETLLVFTPSRKVDGRRMVCYDDRYILKLAAQNDGIVVSNDNYRDLINENPKYKKVVEERLLMYSFVNDRFMPPDDPLGRKGPTLNDFLRNLLTENIQSDQLKHHKQFKENCRRLPRNCKYCQDMGLIEYHWHRDCPNRPPF